MFKKFSEQEIRASIIPFEHLFLTEQQYEEFKKKSRPHVSNEDYTVVREALPITPQNSPEEKIKYETS